jgi:SAM-dependent methyltransferase
MSPPADSRAFWDRAAESNAAWYVATGFTEEGEEFFRLGAAETDQLLALCQVSLTGSQRVLEIGCGVGRMTRRLAALAGSVVAADVSPNMLEACRRNLAGHGNVEFLLVPGDGSLPGVPPQSVDLVFSYITFQHVPTVGAQQRYLAEAARALRPGGRMAIQIRGTSPTARALDWLGHLRHLTQGRHTLSPAWRGARLSDRQVEQAFAGTGYRPVTRYFGRRHRWVTVTPG